MKDQNWKALGIELLVVVIGVFLGLQVDYWAGEYYRQQREKGSAHQSALRALAFKWIRILYRCWQTKTQYDEATYLKALKRRGSPLMSKAV